MKIVLNILVKKKVKFFKNFPSFRKLFLMCKKIYQQIKNYIKLSKKTFKNKIFYLKKINY